MNIMNNKLSSTSLDDMEFGYKVRRVLDERADTLPAGVTDRLQAARRMAIARKKAEVVAVQLAPQRRFALAGGGSSGGNPFSHSLSWITRVGIIIPLIVLVVGAFGIYQYEEERRIDELAELDAAVLSDELPLNAYLDHGFDAYLNKHGE